MSNLVLWGCHLDEYREMFDLTDDLLSGSILEYSSGATAFNTELHAKAKTCISIDPLFNLDKATLKSKTVLLFAEMIEGIKKGQEAFDFSHYGDFEGLVHKRQSGIKKFFADYTRGKKDGRYQALKSIKLDFEDFKFNLALSSHYLFSDIEGQDLNFHFDVIKELARVATEVRIFPLIDKNENPSPLLGPLLLLLQQEGYGAELRQVAYNLQPHGNAMLRVWAEACDLESHV